MSAEVSLKANEFQFEIGDVGYGKYAGRVLADVFIKGESVCDSDNLVEIRNEPDKLKCDDCGNITYKK